jgi:hypothetical protein
MRILKQPVSYEQEVLRDYEGEHRGFEGYQIGLDYLNAANTRWRGRWGLALLSPTEIANVMLPLHRHPIEVIPQSGLSVAAPVQRLRKLPKDQMPKCWERIDKIMNRDFSKMHIAVQMDNDILTHVDGLHRLLAYGLVKHDQDILAYIAGV